MQKFLDRGLAPSLSIDVETNVPSDMFNQMRSVFALQRALAARDGRSPATARDVLAWATVEGARANGLDHKTGTITPGKQADVVMLRTDLLNVAPVNDAATAIVTGMDTRIVDTVIVAGHVLKRDGVLQHVDWEAVSRMAHASRDHVIERSGFRPPKI